MRSNRIGVLAVSLLVLGGLAFFGCDGKNPVAPKGASGSLGRITLSLPRAMTSHGQDVHVMVTLPDGTQYEASSVPAAVPTTTPFMPINGEAQIVLEVPVGPDRHLQIGYAPASGYDY